MHGLWGAHNLQMSIRRCLNKDKGTESELRRFGSLFLWSLLGACGSGMIRNIYTSVTPLDKFNMAFIEFTWVWEWVSLGLIFADLAYYLFKEGGCAKCMGSDRKVQQPTKKEMDSVAPRNPQSPSSS